MPTETTLNSLKVHKVPDFDTWEDNYNQTNGIGVNDVVIIPPEELKKGVLPDQTNNSGKFLTTDGSGNTSWATVDALPSQSGNNGKVLTTNGTTASWANETDPVFEASPAAGITSTDISNWNAKVSDDHKWNDVSLIKGDATNNSTIYIPFLSSSTGTTANITSAVSSPGASRIAKYDSTAYLHSTTPSANDNSTKVATTAYVDAAIPDTSSFITTETDPTVPSWAKASSKPTYSASEVGAVATSAVGANSGVAPLNASGKIDSTYLPSYVDDVIEGYYYNSKFYTTSAHTTEITGETGKIFVDLSTNKTYRYGGSSFTEISQGSIVSVSRDLTSGTKIGTLTINGTGTDLYAPTPESFSVTGGASTIVSDNLTANRALISNASGKVAVSDVTSTELGYLDGVTSAVQTQIDGKQTKITASGLLKGNGSGGVSAAVAGTDYQTPLVSGTDYAPASHSHGNITSGGDITATAPTIANGDQIIINDNSTSKITNGPTFDGSTTSKYLSQKGTWESIPDALPSQTNNSGKYLTTNGTSASWATVSVPSASTTTPSMDGTASYGSGTTWARADHVHPSDTNKQDKITANGILEGDGTGNITAAESLDGSLISTLSADFLEIDSAPASGSNHLVTSGGVYSAIQNSTDVFVAEYGTTTFSEVLQAYNEGKILYAQTGVDFKYFLGQIVYSSTDGETISQFRFFAIEDGRNDPWTNNNNIKLRELNCSSTGGINGWSNSFRTLQENVEALSDLTGNSGKYLTTNGSSVSWATVDALPTQSSSTNNKVLTSVYNSSTSTATASWEDAPEGVFVAYYGITTFSDLKAAILERKIIYVDLNPSAEESPLGGWCFVTKSVGVTRENGEITSIDLADGVGYQATCTSDSIWSFSYNQQYLLKSTWDRHKITYLVCDTAANVAAKTLSIPAGFNLRETGQRVAIRFTYGNTANNPTLDSQPIAFPTSQSTFSTALEYNQWAPNEIVFFVYDGTRFVHGPTALQGHASSSTIYGTGTSSNYGPLKLSDSTSSTSSTSGGIAATPAAVKAAYDLANGKQAPITASGILKGNGSGTVSAAVAGTDYQAPLPSQTNNSGKYLTTNGSALSWGTVDALPSQTGNSGKYLTTNGSAASWGEVSAVTEVTLDTTPTQNSTNPITSNGVYNMVMNRTKIYTGTCTTAAGTTEKVVALDDATGFSLTTGVMVLVLFTDYHDTGTPTLNVNNTGAKTILTPTGVSSYNIGPSTNSWARNERILFTYTGDSWVHSPSGMINYLNSNNRTTHINTADTNYTTLMARGEKLLSSSTFDSATWSSQLVNGAIAWRYE